MTAFQPLPLPLEWELYVDLFAGIGGASDGGASVYRHPDIAINHNPTAIAIHRANHPNTKHFITDVFEVDPVEATGGQPVGILWASPDCRHFSKAKGGKPVNRKIRSLAWVVIQWAQATRPRMIFLENVEEFQDWGPLGEDHKPIKSERGRTFKAFIAALGGGLSDDHPDFDDILKAIGRHVTAADLVRGMGYKVEWQVRVAANAGTPTIRKRLFLIARRDGEPILWTKPKFHQNPGKGQEGWKPVWQCIDFSDLGKSIIDGRLVANSNRRVAKGFWKHVVETDKPFIVPLEDGSLAPYLTEFANASSQRTFSVQEPLRTQCAQVKGGHFALAAANLITLRKGSTGSSLHSPINTLTTNSGHHAIAACFMEQANGGFYDGAGRSMNDPISTITSRGTNQRLAAAFLVKYYKSGGQWQSLHDPAHTFPTKARMGLVTVHQVPADILPPELLDKAKQCAAFLHKYLPEHFPDPVDLVLVGDYVLVDFTLRMLRPRELKLSMGFREDYIIDRGLFEDPVTGALEWKGISVENQIKGIGNAVCPQDPADLIELNAGKLIRLYRAQAA
ncbi:DNA cytosine methyltransferase [Metapseudomonas resinovorans]|uniref:DNA cytosine methyltransferase n=1 Tax=Metapseudomonas resinovorans TaxID=53412 RepID=UPI00041AF458|nr:DNA cytosine methyltransferase [Pseudomonas resinovorans]